MKKIVLASAVCASMMFATSNYNYEVTPMIGGVYSEGNLDIERNYLDAGLAFGFNQQDSFIDQVELGFLRTIKDAKYRDALKSKGETSITRLFANLVKEYPMSSDFSMYALVGGGVALYGNGSVENNDSAFANYGVGLKYKVAQRAALKFDVRHIVEFDNDKDNNLLYTLGLSIPFGEVAKAVPVVKPVKLVADKPKDSDGDGVVDYKDRCPDTLPGVKVDANGCELDSDGDGVVDRLDQCPNTIEGAKVDNVGCMTLVNLNINFDTNSSNIRPVYNSRLEAFANMMKQNSMLKATIEAHTDSVGSAKYNKKLSQRRATSTINALKALNVDASRLTPVGYGETKPVATNKTAEGRAENRRVHAVINK